MERFTGNEKIFYVDDDGRQQSITFAALADYIHRHKFVTASESSWNCSDKYFFPYDVVVQTSEGAYQKYDREPAIVTYAMYQCYHRKTKSSDVMSTVLFIGKTPGSVTYIDPDDEINDEASSFIFNEEHWYYNLIRKPVRLTGYNEIKQHSIHVYPSFNDALQDIMEQAGIKPGVFYSGFSDNSDVIFSIGAMSADKEIYAPIVMDNQGVIICNKIIERDETDET